MRGVNALERFVIEGVARLLPQQRSAQLLADLGSASVDGRGGEKSISSFIIQGYESARSKGQHTYPVEIAMKDEDGADLTIMLYADRNERLCEMEIIRWDDQPLICPDMDSVRFYG